MWGLIVEWPPCPRTTPSGARGLGWATAASSMWDEAGGRFFHATKRQRWGGAGTDLWTCPIVATLARRLWWRAPHTLDMLLRSVR